MTDWDEMALVGRVARTHGNRGQVIVDPETDFPEERYRVGAVLYTRRPEGREIEALTVTAVRFHRGRPIVAFEGVDTMSGAEELAGQELRITAEALHPLPPGTFYQHDLIGCRVETAEGIAVGTVSGIDGAGRGMRLVVEGRRGTEVLIPLNDAIVTGVHLAARKIVVRPPDGLLDLNETKKRIDG